MHKIKIENNIVAKGNKLVEARYKISVQEQRLLALMISDIKPSDKAFKPYRYKIQDFMRILKIEGKDYYRKIAKITEKLLTRIISIPKPNGGLLQISWLSSAEYKNGVVELSFDPKLKPYLLQLQKNFTRYKIGEILSMKSKYAFRLFEILKQWETPGKKSFEVIELRAKLGLMRTELKQWQHFKTRVLNIATREINAKTSLDIGFETEKTGRKITSVIFSIKKKLPAVRKPVISDRSGSLGDGDVPELKLRPGFENLKGLKALVLKSLTKNGQEYTERNIAYANLNAKTNYAAFLKKSITEDWTAGAEAAGAENKKKQEKEKEKSDMEMKKIIERSKQSLRRDMENLSSNSLQNLADRGNEVAKEILNSRVKG